MSLDLDEFFFIPLAATILLIVLGIHKVVALRLLSRRLLPGTLALFAPLPVAVCAASLPVLIAIWIAVFEPRSMGRGSNPAHALLDAIQDISSSSGGQLAWCGAMLLAVLPLTLSIVAHLGVTPRRPGLEDLDDGYDDLDGSSDVSDASPSAASSASR